MLDNPRSERIKRVAALSGRSARKKTGNILVEGPGAVRELLDFRAKNVRDVYFTQDAAERHSDLFERATQCVSWVHTVSPDVSAKISHESQGIAAVSGVDAIRGNGIQIDPPGSAFWVLLPEIQDPGNLGTLIRTADAMGARGVFLGRGTCDVSSPKVIRSSAGSVFHLPITSGDFLEEAARLRAMGVALLGTSLQSRSVPLSDMLTDTKSPLRVHHAWVFGNEARGLDPAEAAVCDRLVHISMAGRAESLKVSSAAAMCMFASSLAV